jgi:polyisoprenoid-binding protein YceI
MNTEDGMTEHEESAPADLQALLQDGTFAGEWVLDAARSEVLLETKHTWGLRPVHGVFQQVTGGGTVTAAGQVSGTITIAAASIDTKSTMRDKDLRSAKVFDVARHPDISYTVDGIQGGNGSVRVTGQLTVRGQARPVAFDAQVTAIADEVRLEARVPVNRADFGLTYSPLGMASLDNVITLRLVFARQ